MKNFNSHLVIYLNPQKIDDQLLRKLLECVSQNESRSVSDVCRLIFWDFMERYSVKHSEILKIMGDERFPANSLLK